MNQVIFANKLSDSHSITEKGMFKIAFTPISDIKTRGGDTITDIPNEDFIIEYKTPSNTIKSIEVNRETLSIQKVNALATRNDNEYCYEINIANTNLGENPAVQIIRQDAVPHQRNSWYIELDKNNVAGSFWNQLKILSKSYLLGIENIENPTIYAKFPLTFKFIDNPDTGVELLGVVKSPYQYLQMLLTKHVQNFGYNHTDNNAELNSGLADYKAWMADTENDGNVVVYRLRFATNRKASKTRDERVWQNVYICTKADPTDDTNHVGALLEEYTEILEGGK